MGSDGFTQIRDQKRGITCSSIGLDRRESLNFETFKEPKNRFQVTNSASLCSLAVLYDNPIPTRFLAPIDCLKIPAHRAGVRRGDVGYRLAASMFI